MLQNVKKCLRGSRNGVLRSALSDPGRWLRSVQECYGNPRASQGVRESLKEDPGVFQVSVRVLRSL